LTAQFLQGMFYLQREKGKMKLFDAYSQAIDEENDPAERDELSSDIELKTLILDEIGVAMKEIRDKRADNPSATEIIKPLFSCVAFWFIIGTRVGKILRDAELAGK
jgi:hypothetical protein